VSIAGLCEAAHSPVAIDTPAPGLPMIRVGVISDTHNLLRPEALAFLRGSDHIVHAGDICNAEVLSRLAELAPLTAVRGNNDKGAWAGALPEIEFVTIGRVRLCVIHDLAGLDRASLDPEVRVVISGHSHRPSVTERDGLLFLNPGSAGPRRFSLPVSVAEIAIDRETVSARIETLAIARS
jgi:putative phosphoesterase